MVFYLDKSMMKDSLLEVNIPNNMTISYTNTQQLSIKKIQKEKEKKKKEKEQKMQGKKLRNIQ